MNRRTLLSGVSALTGVLMMLPAAHAAEVFRVGDVNSYSKFPSSTEPSQKAMKMVFDEVNAKGGVAGGITFQMVSRDDGSSPATLTTVLDELTGTGQIDAIIGAGLSSTSLAAAAYAKQHKIIYIATHATTDALSLDGGNRYTLRARSTIRGLVGALMEEAKKKQPKRWALVLPNYEFGLKIAEAFKAHLARDFPGATIVAEQYPALGKMDVGATTQALLAAKPDAILNGMFGVDLPKFVREGELRGLFEGRQVYSVLTGNPEYLRELKDEAPVGWIVTGWPYDAIKRPENVAFIKAWRERYKGEPGEGVLIGYLAAKLLVSMVEKAGSKDTEKMLAVVDGLKFSSPTGEITMRGIDNQGNAPVYVGKIELFEGKGRMIDNQEIFTGPFLPTEQEIKAVRPNG
jgi:branched-chain amino acid transport system substrate-binding protein